MAGDLQTLAAIDVGTNSFHLVVARLIHLGVLQAIPVFDRRLLLCDIGGGSTEILIGERGEALTARSFKLGAVRLTNRFFPGQRLHPGAVSSCRGFVRSTLSPYSREVAGHGFEVAVGSSGTIHAVAAMAQAVTGGEPPRSFNRFRLTADDVRDVCKELIAATAWMVPDEPTATSKPCPATSRL